MSDVSSNAPKILPDLCWCGDEIHGLQALTFGRQAFDETQGCDDEQHGQEAQQTERDMRHEARHSVLHD